MISITHKGDFKNTENLLNRIKRLRLEKIADKYGEIGVEALRSATPIRTGKTAGSWYYEVVQTPDGVTIFWNNSNVVDYVNIAFILDKGHGTKSGAFVQGRNYIEPAIRPIFEELAKSAWEEVTNAK
jgi:hypothetical protein